MEDTTTSWNHVEFVLTDETSTNHDKVNVNLNKNQFYQVLESCNIQQKKFFVRTITRYLYNDLIYEICNQKDVKTYQKKAVSYERFPNLIKLKFKKEKLPYHMFPSTTNINEVQNVSSIVIRFHNNVYLNFEIIEFDTPIYKIYVNYNHEENIDIDYINSILKEVQCTICSSGLHLANFSL